MTDILVKKFIKNYDDVDDTEVRTGYGTLASIVGIICNIVLCTMKIVIGVISSSVSIIADGINNLSDASSSVITLVGFILAKKPADEEHPFGHARMEYLSGLAIAALIIVIGVQLAQSSITKIIHPEDVSFSGVLVVIMLISIAVKAWMCLFNKKLGKRINSTSLIATSEDSRNDVITTIAVLTAAIVSHYTGVDLDGAIGLLVAAFILWSGIGIARDTISPLLGETTNPELMKLIEDKMLDYDPRILGIHDLMVHDYGPGQQFASVHAELDASENVLVTHELLDNIERMFREKYHIQMVIHYDPVIVNDPEQNKLKEEVKEIIGGIDSRLKIHDFRIVKGSGHTNLVFDLVLPSEFIGKEKELQKKIEDTISTADMRYYAVITFDSESFNKL